MRIAVIGAGELGALSGRDGATVEGQEVRLGPQDPAAPRRRDRGDAPSPRRR
jgi:hypothetical protein